MVPVAKLLPPAPLPSQPSPASPAPTEPPKPSLSNALTHPNSNQFAAAKLKTSRFQSQNPSPSPRAQPPSKTFRRKLPQPLAPAPRPQPPAPSQSAPAPRQVQIQNVVPKRETCGKVSGKICENLRRKLFGTQTLNNFYKATGTWFQSLAFSCFWGSLSDHGTILLPGMVHGLGFRV